MSKKEHVILGLSEEYVTVAEYAEFKNKLAELTELGGKISRDQHAKLVEYHHRLCRLEKCLELIGLDISVGFSVKVPE